MAEESAKLRIPYIAASQAQKHVTHNEAMTLLDTLVQLSVLDKDLTSPPGSPAEGDCYIVAGGGGTATGAWAGWEKRVARFIDGEWRSYLPGAGSGAGWLAWVMDEDAMYRFDGTAWALAGIEGPAGPAGPPGPTGPTGPAGASALTICRAKTTANVNLASGGLANGTSHDGVTLATGDRVLVTAQTAQAENGVYIVPASGAASRDAAFDTYDEHPGVYVSVMEGTANADTLWRCTSNRGGTLGTDPIVFSQFQGGGGAGLPHVGIRNGKIVVSAASNVLTAALKTLAGNDPSASDPVVIYFPDGSTITQTSPLSFTITQGSTMGFGSSGAGRLWFPLVNNSGSLLIGARNCSDANGVSGFSPLGVLSTNAEGGAGGADAVKTTYAASAVSNKPFVIAAFSDWDTVPGTPGNWTSPSRTVQFAPGIPGPGQVVQSSFASTNTGTSNSTTSYVDTNLSVPFTLGSAANLVSVNTYGVILTGAGYGLVANFRDSTQIGNEAAAGPTNGSDLAMTCFALDKPNGIGPFTYKARVKSNAAGVSITFNATSHGGNMFVQEIMG